MFYDKLSGGSVRCRLCPHNCTIAPSEFGLCGVRQNKDSCLKALTYGKSIARQIDPIEKKPLYHFLPGTRTYSLAAGGCNLQCGFCQNWQISQVADQDLSSLGHDLSPEDIAREASSEDCAAIAYTYTEPTVFFEYVYETAKLARAAGIKNVFISNGFINKEALKTLSSYLDAANIDLKSFREEFYLKHCRGRLKPVLETIQLLKELGVWVEVTTLVIPGHNDSEQELSEIAGFLAGIAKDIPWHISRFHPDYNFMDSEPTSLDTLETAARQGESAGLKYVYKGNIDEGPDTRCPACRNPLIKRSGFRVVESKIQNGKCRFCAEPVSGIFE